MDALQAERLEACSINQCPLFNQVKFIEIKISFSRMTWPRRQHHDIIRKINHNSHTPHSTSGKVQYKIRDKTI